MGSLTTYFKEEFKKINKIRTFTLLTFLAILVSFPLITSGPQQSNDIKQRAQAQAPAQGTPAFMIYGTAHVGDTFAPGWITKTWYGGGNTVNQTNTDPVYLGTHSIAYQSTAPADTLEMYTNTPIDISKYKYLNFFGRAAMNGLRFQVTLLGPLDTNGNHKPIGTALTFEQNGGIPPTDRWYVYGFPIASFNAGTNQIYGIGIMDLNGGGAQQPVYLDEIAFSEQRATETTPTPQIGPPSTPMPTPTPIPPYYPDISPWVFIIPAIIIFIAVFFE